MEDKKTNPEVNIEETGTETLNLNENENSTESVEESESVISNSTDKLTAEIEEQKDKYLRLFAEFDNYKRRVARERSELIQTAGKEVLTAMLDVLDDSERAEKQLQTTDDVAQIKEGIQLVFNKLKSTLHAKGLKPLESINQEFDVEKHEAISEIPAPTPALSGKVIDEVQKGYYLNDKLIRFAKVIVGK